MINKTIFTLICMVVLIGSYCRAQSTNSQAISLWGDGVQGVQGVQLSIAMTNNNVSVGSSATVMSVTRNLATNDIILNIAVPTLNFDLMLSNGAGKLYHVTARLPIRGSMHQLKTIKPGEKSFEPILATFGEDIEPGDYTLKATRHFKTNMGEFMLESNSIKIQIIK